MTESHFRGTQGSLGQAHSKDVQVTVIVLALRLDPMTFNFIISFLLLPLGFVCSSFSNSFRW